MNTSTPYPVTQVQSPLPEPALWRSTSAKIARQDLETCLGTPTKSGSKDPHGLGASAPLAFAAYLVAIEYHPKLSNRTLGENAVLQRLRKMVPNSAFRLDFVARQMFKLINPYGHGANSTRFNNETLGWFRQTYPADSHLTAGLILVLCAAKWWTYEQGYRSTIPRASPLITSDLDSKLKSFGFLAGERQAICRMLRRDSIRR